jgi:hypothetical protein
VQFLCPSSGVIYCTFGDGIFLAGLMTDSQHGQDGTPWSSILTVLGIWKFIGLKREAGK